MADQYFDTAAELGSEEEDEDFDEVQGNVRRKTANGTGGLEDSSDEEEEDDDELLREVRHSLYERLRSAC